MEKEDQPNGADPHDKPNGARRHPERGEAFEVAIQPTRQQSTDLTTHCSQMSSMGH